MFIKVPLLLVERVGGECCGSFFNIVCFGAPVEAFADVFYVFLTHGDAVWCLMCQSYLGEKLDSLVCGGVGVVKRLQV